MRGDFAATLERILRRIRRLTGRALLETVLKLSDGGWLLVVADAAELAGVVGQTHSEKETLDLLYSQYSDATICAFQRMVGAKGAPGAYNCDFPCVSG